MFESCVKINYCIKNQKQWLIVILCFDKTDETKLKKKTNEIDQSLNMSLDITYVCLSLIVVSIITT